jgi:hypothetical protein
MINNPDESWQKYLNQISLAYKAAGLIDATDEMKQAHLLSGLEGKAKQYFEANPELTDTPYEELKETLKKKFDKPNLQRLIDIGLEIQKPGESCSEFVARLREAAKAINAEEDFILVTKREALAAAEAVRGDQRNEDTIRVQREEVQNHIEQQKKFVDKFVFHYFIRGLIPSLKRHVLDQGPRTLEKALELALKREQYFEVYGELVGNETAMINLTAARDEIVEKAAKQLQALNIKKGEQGREIDKTKENLQRNNNRPSSSTRPQVNSSRNAIGAIRSKTASSETARCYFCARPGHIARECKTRARYMQAAGHGGDDRGRYSSNQPTGGHMRPMQTPGPSHGQMARHEHSGKQNMRPFSAQTPREARSTWVDFLFQNQPYPASKNGVRRPQWGGSTPFPHRNQPKYSQRQ